MQTVFPAIRYCTVAVTLIQEF